jgi:hypothetical protein
MKYISILFLFCFIINTSAINFYIDKNATGNNSGSSWSDAWERFEDINWKIICPGDIIYISGGIDSTIYYETLTTGKSGTSERRILITKGTDAGHNGKVVIDGGGTRRHGIKIGLNDYITVTGILLRNSIHGLIKVSRSNYIIIENCELLVYGRAGIFIQNCTGSELKGCTIKTGIYVKGQTDGIYSQHNNNNIYDHNHIVINNSEPSGHDDCIQSYQDNNLTIHSNYCEQNNNKTSNALGIFAEMPTGGVFRFYNNIVNMGNTKSAGILFIRKLKGKGTIVIIGNTLYGKKSYSLIRVTETTDPVIKNNIIFAGGTAFAVKLEDWNGNANNIDNNLVYAPNVAKAWFFNGILKNRRQWRELGFDVHGKNADPMFNNLSQKEFSLQAGSPAINSGANLGSPYNLDIIGVARPFGDDYDIGCYEWTGQ